MALRAEQARLLGYENFAEYRLDDTMAKTSAAVEGLLMQIWEPAKDKARDERAALEAVARAEGLNEPIEPWDWRYYAEKVRRARYDLDEAEIKPYFVLDNMVRAAFDTAGRLFGLTFTERQDLPVYHPDVRVWEVRDEVGQPCRAFSARQFCPARQAIGRLVERLPRSGKHGRAGGADRRQQQQLHARGCGCRRTDPIELRRRQDTVSRVRPRAAFIAEPSALPLAIRYCGATRLCRVPVPDLRALDVGAGNFADLRPPLPNRRASARGPAAPAYRGAKLQPGLRHGGVYGRRPDRPRSAPRSGDRDPRSRLGSSAISWTGWRYQGKSGCVIVCRTSSTCSPAAATPPAIIPICGPKCWTPTASPPSPRPATLFDPELAARLKAIYSAGDTRDPMELYRAFRGREPAIAALLQQRGLAAAQSG